MLRAPIPAILAWLGAALLAIGAWLLLPRDRTASGPPVRIVMFDVSASAHGEFLHPMWFRGQDQLDVTREKAQRAGEERIGIAFGRGARRFDLDVRPDRKFGEPEDASDLAAAFELATRIAEERRVVAIDVIGDGTYTGADPTPIAARLAGRGVAIDQHVALHFQGDDAGVAPLRSPLLVRAGAPISVDVEAWHARGIPGTQKGGPHTLIVTASLVEGARTEIRTARIALAGQPFEYGLHPVRVRFDFGPLVGGSAEVLVRATIEVEGKDWPTILPENDTTRATVRAEGQALVLVVGTPERRAAFAQRLEPAARDLGLRFADRVSADALRDADAVVSIAHEFTAEEATLLDDAVARGRGWFDLAGPNFAGTARPRATALVPAGDENGPRGIVVLVDASGSMNGEPGRVSRAALASLVDTAPHADALEARWLHDGGVRVDALGNADERVDAARRAAFRDQALAGPNPRGPTQIWSALEQLASGLDGSRRTLAILVSDGRDPDRADLAARANALRAQLAAKNARLVVVEVGGDPDRELLAALAGAASDVLAAGDLAAMDARARLAEMFTSAIARGSIAEFAPAREVRVSAADAPFAALFQNLALPTVRRALRARAVNSADVVWTTDDGAALLAFARTGLGVAATMAFPPDPTWLGSENDLVGSIATAIRAVLPPNVAGAPTLFERDGDLVLFDPAGRAPPIVRLELTSKRAERLGIVDLVAGRLGHDPLRERSAALPAALARLEAGETVEARIQGDTTGLQSFDFTAPRAPEFARLPRQFTPPAPIRGAAPTAPGPNPLGPWVLLAGIAALSLATGAGFFSSSPRRAA